MRNLALYVLFAILLFASCHPERPSNVISESKMASILYDYHIAQSIADAERDSNEFRRYAYIQKVFEKHGVTEAEFDSSMLWYSANAGYLHQIYIKLEERLSAELAMSGTNSTSSTYAALTTEGDTANIWSGPNMLVLLQDSPEYIYLFKYDVDTAFHQGDVFLLHGNTRFLQTDGHRNAAASLYVRYQGDSVTTEMQTLRQDGEFELRVTADTSLIIKEIGGFFCYVPAETPDDAIRRWFVIDPVLVRMHRYFEPQNVELQTTDTLMVDSLATDTTLLPIKPIDSIAVDDKRRIQPRAAIFPSNN